MPHDPDPPACLPGEESLVDLDTFEKAGRAIVEMVPADDEPIPAE